MSKRKNPLLTDKAYQVSQDSQDQLPETVESERQHLPYGSYGLESTSSLILHRSGTRLKLLSLPPKTKSPRLQPTNTKAAKDKTSSMITI